MLLTLLSSLLIKSRIIVVFLFQEMFHGINPSYAEEPSFSLLNIEINFPFLHWVVSATNWHLPRALWFWRRLLRVPWTARRSNQSILKEISPGCSLEGLMLMLKLQYSGHLMRRVTHWKRLWCWKGLGAGGKGDDRGWDGWMAWVWVNSESWWWTWRPGVLQFTGSQRVGHDWATELNWAEGDP